MIAAAVAMLRGRKDVADESAGPLPVAKIVLQGAAVGLISGLVGAGGGFLLVPALALLGGLPMPVAVGTSLVVISMRSFAGFAGHLASEQIDWKLAAMVTAAAVVGSVIGGRLTSYVQPATLRKAFGWFVLVMASVVLGEEIDPRWASRWPRSPPPPRDVLRLRPLGHCPLRRVLDQRGAVTAR